jgi:hypothetical protein
MPDNKREHAIGQFRLQLNGVFEPFTFYGQDIYIHQAKIEVEKMALALHRRLNGEDVPIIK